MFIEDNIEVLECIEKATNEFKVCATKNGIVSVWNYGDIDAHKSYDTMSEFFQDYLPSENKVDQKRFFRKFFHNDSSYNDYMRKANAAQKR